MLYFTYTASHQSELLEDSPELRAQSSLEHEHSRYTTCTMEKVPVQIQQQDQPRQVSRVEITAIHRYTATQGIACHLRGNVVVIRLYNAELVKMAELQATQEEADTCLLVHALHATISTNWSVQWETASGTA